MKRILLVAALAAVVLAPLFWLPGPEDRGIGAQEPIGAVMEDVRVVSRQDGRILWTLQTDEASIPIDGYEAFLNAVTMDFPSEGMTVSALEGRYGLDDGSLSLEGDVQAVTSDYVIDASSVELDSKTGAITSKSRVVMEGEDFSVIGSGLRALGGKVWFTHGVEAEFH